MSRGGITTLSKQKTCLLSVDVEDWFHLVGAGLDYQFRFSPGGMQDWEMFDGRLHHTVPWLLDLFAAFKVKATFFILGWVAERSPELVRAIAEQGHEIASHGYNHRVLSRQTPDEFREDVQRSQKCLQNIIGRTVLGFRCSSASITDWAIDILAQEGFLYDSSLFPATYHDVYGKLKNSDPNKPVERLSNGLWEVKFSSLKIAQYQIPWSGGGYFRLLPYPIFKWGVTKILEEQGVFNFYIHPWETDEECPRLANLKTFYAFRRYVGIKRARARLERMLMDFNFMSIADYLVLHSDAG